MNKDLVVHAEQMFEFQGQYTDEELKNWAARNEQLYVVRSITDHRMEKGNLQLYLTWEGYDDDEGTWTTFNADINKLEALGKYLELHPDLKLPSNKRRTRETTARRRRGRKE